MPAQLLVIIAYAVFAVGCTTAPKNTVGAAYDADSSYCRGLAKSMVEVQGYQQDSPSDRDLYEQHCEPTGSWLARDPQGLERTVASERSLFTKLLNKIF